MKNVTVSLDDDVCYRARAGIARFRCKCCMNSRTNPQGAAGPTAWTMVTSRRRFPVRQLTLAVLDHARRIELRTLYPVRDSLIAAAAQARGCDILYTEDVQDKRIIDRLRIVNPLR